MTTRNGDTKRRTEGAREMDAQSAVVCATSYGAAIEDANRRYRRGERQAQCRDCHRWFWPGQDHDHPPVPTSEGEVRDA